MVYLFDVSIGSHDLDRLDVLADLIVEYEDIHYPHLPAGTGRCPEVPDGTGGAFQKDLVPSIGSLSHVREVLAGKREITPTMARALDLACPVRG